MFDLNATDGSVRTRKFESPVPHSEEPGAQQMPANRLDGPVAVDLHGRLLSYYTTELDKQHLNRREMAQEEDFYDNIQWTEEDAQVLIDRGQKPIVYNVISASIDWVTGTERRARTDFKILPRRKEGGNPALKKTELMKYLSDVNRTPFHVSRAFTDGVKAGLGWIEDGISDTTEEEPLFTRYENWRNMLHDSSATEMDLSDARYIFRSKWFDEDIAAATFESRKGLVEKSVSDTDDYMSLDAYADEAMDSQETELERNRMGTADRVHGHARRRVRIIEAWIRMPVKAERLKGGPFTGELYDSRSRGHRASVESGEAQVVKKVTMRMHVAIFTTSGMLWLSESPYRHNQFPFTPIWGKRRAKDGLPYGMVRNIKDIQEDINKRASKAQWVMSQNRIIMDDDALSGEDAMTVDELIEEAARPDGVIIKKRGSELKFETDRDLSQFQLELMSRSIAMIQQSSGVTDELLGRETGAKSGIAIQRRQDQGSMATALYFDNHRLAMQLRGEKQLSNIEQFMDERKQFRITNMRGKPEYVDINDGMPDNDIVMSKADFVISDEDWHASMRQAAVDSLLEVLTRLPPQVGLILLDLVVENMDIPNRDEVVKRIRAMTGQKDPDAADEPPTPEEQAQMQAKAEADKLTRDMMLAQLRKVTADAAKAEAAVEQIMAQLAGTNVSSQSAALTAASTAFSLPPAAVHAADLILEESGFTPASRKQLSPPSNPVAPGLGGMAPPTAPPMPSAPQPA